MNNSIWPYEKRKEGNSCIKVDFSKFWVNFFEVFSNFLLWQQQNEFCMTHFILFRHLLVAWHSSAILRWISCLSNLDDQSVPKRASQCMLLAIKTVSLLFSTASKTFAKGNLHPIFCANAEVFQWFALNNWLVFAKHMTSWIPTWHCSDVASKFDVLDDNLFHSFFNVLWHGTSLVLYFWEGQCLLPPCNLQWWDVKEVVKASLEMSRFAYSMLEVFSNRQLIWFLFMYPSLMDTWEVDAYIEQSYIVMTTFKKLINDNIWNNHIKVLKIFSAKLSN